MEERGSPWRLALVGVTAISCAAALHLWLNRPKDYLRDAGSPVVRYGASTILIKDESDLDRLRVALKVKDRGFALCACDPKVLVKVNRRNGKTERMHFCGPDRLGVVSGNEAWTMDVDPCFLSTLESLLSEKAGKPVSILHRR